MLGLRCGGLSLLVLVGLGCSDQAAPHDGERRDASVGPQTTPAAEQADAASAASRDTGSQAPEDAASAPEAEAPSQVQDAARDAPQTVEDAATLREDAAAARDAELAESAVGPETDGGADAAARPPQSPTAKYHVVRYTGGLDHLTIHKRDAARGYCILAGIAFPSAPSNRYQVELPKSWSMVNILAIEGNDSCEQKPTAPATPVSRSALKAEGRIAFRDLGASGDVCSLDLDIVATFDPVASIPQQDHLFAEDLPVPCTP
jgi:hypothetical protein